MNLRIKAGIPAALAALCTVVSLFGADKRPNIIVVLVDDMGWSDIGCYGSEIPTPNLDALAKGGLRYTQFYNTARCSPSRASLLTGLYPHQAGMGHLDYVILPGSQGTTGRIADRAVTMGEVLGDAGYFTATVGKWHVGLDHGTAPWQRGFQRSLTSPSGQLYFPNQVIDESHGKLFLNGSEIGLTDPRLGSDWYSTALFTTWGLKFIDEARAEKKPFFLYLAYCAPHFPLMAPAETIARFRGKYLAGWDKLREERHQRQIQMGLVDAAWPMTPRPDEVAAWDSFSAEKKTRFDEMMSIYAAMITEVDSNIGRLVQSLRESGELDNTLIFFLADNGGNAESGPGGRTRGDPLGGPTSSVFLGMEWATLNNTPFRRYKHFTHEGGISTPLIAHWPAGIPAARDGQLVRDPGNIVDIMATVSELGHAPYPKTRAGHDILPMSGRSLVPTFTGLPLVRPEPIFFAHEGNKALRDGKWKLVQKHLGPWELYDMEVDRTELHDLAAEQPERVKALAARWDAWAAKSFVETWPGGLRQPWGDAVVPEKFPE